jgi:hypothetical protein
MTVGLIAAGKLGYDIVAKDFRIATNTLLLVFAAFQTLAIGFLADLIVRATAARHSVDPSSI